MKFKFIPAVFFAPLLAFHVAQAAPAAPPGYENSLPQEYVSSQPALPQYLPGGGVNLDEAWILDGPARMYWNSTYIPKQINLAGATWVDPALVPQLVIQEKQPVKKRVVRRVYKRRAPVKKKTVARAPKNAGVTRLKPPAIPLPVTPAPEPAIPPLSANDAPPPPTPRLQ